uniref:T4 RNA ligase 1-like N-terminal domain-containing protein n=1 Tax=viral metagenome TaxID=1070528 RepID=A0A6C0KW27_9ZZZZ
MSSVIYNLNSIPGFDNIISQNVSECLYPLKINKINCESSNKQKYSVIRYDKTFLCDDQIPTAGLLRSVVLNKDNRVVSFAPPKSIPWLTFSTLYPEKKSNIVAEEFVEGTMINVFWDSNIGISGGWEIATRSNVGAEVSFYKDSTKPSTNTFRSMFMEAVSCVGLDFNKLNPLYSYSFVLQHPQNRIVIPFSKPQLYLVAVYEILHTEGNIINITQINMNLIKNQKDIWEQTTIKFPEIYEDWENCSELVDKYASMNTNYCIVGVIVKNLDTGSRTKFRNPVYENVRHLRGNQPKLMYQYLSLRQEDKIKEYLGYYPEHKKEFAFFRDLLHKYTLALYQNYIDCYIKKQKPLKEYGEIYRTHMYNIHQIYVNELKELRQHVTNRVVIEYVNKVHPNLQMYALNFDMRKRHIDILQVEKENKSEEILMQQE